MVGSTAGSKKRLVQISRADVVKQYGEAARTLSHLLVWRDGGSVAGSVSGCF